MKAASSKSVLMLSNHTIMPYVIAKNVSEFEILTVRSYLTYDRINGYQVWIISTVRRYSHLCKASDPHMVDGCTVMASRLWCRFN